MVDLVLLALAVMAVTVQLLPSYLPLSCYLPSCFAEKSAWSTDKGEKGAGKERTLVRKLAERDSATRLQEEVARKRMRLRGSACGGLVFRV